MIFPVASRSLFPGESPYFPRMRNQRRIWLAILLIAVVCVVTWLSFARA